MTFSKIGTDTLTNQTVTITQPSRRQGTYIIGSNGTGKSGLIENLVVQDIRQGIGVCVLDPHGDLVNNILSRMSSKDAERTILLDITNDEYLFGLNLFECPDPTNALFVQRIINQVMHIFDRIYDINESTPHMYYYFLNASYTIMANPGYTIVDIPLLFTDAKFRKHLVDNVKDTEVARFWRDYEGMVLRDQLEARQPILNKLFPFTRPILKLIFGQSETTLDFWEIMQERKILLVKLDSRLEKESNLLGAVIIAQILNAAYARGDTAIQKRKQFNLYADEFQRFATEDFATLIDEARKFGIATTIAHQHRSQLDSKTRSATLGATNLMVFKVSGSDAKELAENFKTTPVPATETRVEAVRSIAPNPVERLLTYGHENPLVRRYIRDSLARYPEEIKLLKKRAEEAKKDMEAQEQMYRTYMNKPLLERELHYQLELHGNVRDKKIFMLEYLDQITLFEDLMKSINEFFVKAMEWWIEIPVQWRMKFPQYWKPEEYFTGNISSIIGQLRVYEDKVTLQRRLDYSWHYHVEFTDADYQVHRDTASKIINHEDYSFSEEYYWVKKPAEDARYIWWICEIITKNPILIETGQYKEIVVEKTRTYADMQDQIANDLATLPKFTTKVRVTSEQGVGEHIIQTDKPPYFNEQAMGNNLADILQRMLFDDNLLRLSAVVEAEIMGRQLNMEEPKRTRRKEPLQPEPEPPEPVKQPQPSLPPVIELPAAKEKPFLPGGELFKSDTPPEKDVSSRVFADLLRSIEETQRLPDDDYREE